MVVDVGCSTSLVTYTIPEGVCVTGGGVAPELPT